MLNNQIETIKNIIFLKLLCLGFVFIALCFLLPRLAKENNHAILALENATTQLKNLNDKIASIEENSNNLLAAETYYKDILREPSNSTCIERLALISSIKQYTTHLPLLTKIDLKVSTPVQEVNDSLLTQWVIVKSNDVALSFSTASIMSFINHIEQIYNHIPEYKTVDSFEINKDKILNIENLDNFIPGSEPNLVQGKLEFKVKSIKIDKAKLFKSNDIN